jgi:hypothetical protein
MRYRSAPSVVNLSGEVAKPTLFQRAPSREGLQLIHVLDGSATPENRVRRRSAQVLPVSRRDDCRHGAGGVALLLSTEGFTPIAVTPLPGGAYELDVDFPRTVERGPA